MSINVVSFSSSGGAGIVAKTLVEGFTLIGLQARLLVASSTSLRDDPLGNLGLTTSAAIDQFVIKSSNWKSLVSMERDARKVMTLDLADSDLNVFRWMNGLLGRRFTEANECFGNLVWGLDDMNPFTGVCHHSGYCKGFEFDCRNCPAVRMPFRRGARLNLEHKLHFADVHNPKYVAPTDWIHGEFQKSRLGQGRQSTKILNPLQARFFENFKESRTKSSGLRLIVVAANLDDPTKGVWEVKDSLNRFLDKHDSDVTLIGRYSNNLASSIPKARFTGPLDPASVMSKMREHDVLLVPSLFENAGTVVGEAASQGLPTIAREVGGMPEMTNYGSTGYLFNTNQELDEILNSLSTKELSSKGFSAKEWAQQLKPELIATQYAEAFL